MQVSVAHMSLELLKQQDSRHSNSRSQSVSYTLLQARYCLSRQRVEPRRFCGCAHQTDVTGLCKAGLQQHSYWFHLSSLSLRGMDVRAQECVVVGVLEQGTDGKQIITWLYSILHPITTCHLGAIKACGSCWLSPPRFRQSSLVPAGHIFATPRDAIALSLVAI